MTDEQMKAMVKQAGGIYVGVQSGCGLVGGDILMLQRVKGGNTIAVYVKSIRDVHDIELALKADAEKYAPVFQQARG